MPIKPQSSEANDVLSKLRTDQQGVSVVFTKKDGTVRKMLSTLIESNIPADKRPKQVESETASKTAGSSVRVFDLEAGEWRSFIWESVTSINGVKV